MANLETGYNASGVAQTYTTATLAKAGGSSDGTDQINCHYSNATMNRFWFESLHNAASTQGIGVQGDSTELPNRQCVFVIPTNSAFAIFSGDLSGVSSQFRMQNLTVLCGERQKYFVQWNDTTGGGNGVRVTNCHISSASFGVRHVAGDANVVQVDNCFLIGCVYGVYTDQPMKVYFTTVIGSLQDGINCNGSASTLTNCYCGYSAVGADLDELTNATVSYCATSDATATGTGSLTNKYDPTDLDFWSDAVADITGGTRGLMIDPRIVTTSDLYQAGTPVAGITTDCDGNTRDVATPSIGWHEGTADPYEWPAGSAPNAPDISVAWLTSTSLRVTISNSDGTPTNYAVYATETDGGDTWVAGGNRSGDGTIDIAGLTEGTVYYIAVYSQSGGYNSQFSNIVKIHPIASAGAATPLLFMGYPRLIQPATFKREDSNYRYYEYKYALAVNMTLTQASLMPGDALPEDATAEIFNSHITKNPGKAERIAVVIARFENAWAD